jgi:hypothetical protein
LSVIFNGDEGKGQLLRGTLTQDFREVHAVSSLVFMVSEELETEGNSYVFMGSEWEVITHRRMSSEGGFVYSVLGYPAGSSKLVSSSYGSLRELANAAGCVFDEESEDVPFEFPLNGVRLAPLLYKYRYQSFEQNPDDAGSALFLFLDQRGLVGRSYKSLVSSKAGDFDVGPLSGTLSTYQVKDKLRNEYREDPVPRSWGYKRLVTGLVGDKVEMKGIASGVVGKHYILHTGESEIDDMEKLILIRQRYDSSKGVQPWVVTFGKLLV